MPGIFQMIKLKHRKDMELRKTTSPERGKLILKPRQWASAWSSQLLYCPTYDILRF